MLPPCSLTKLQIKLYNCGKTECLAQMHCCLRTSDEKPEQTFPHGYKKIVREGKREGTNKKGMMAFITAKNGSRIFIFLAS